MKRIFKMVELKTIIAAVAVAVCGEVFALTGNWRGDLKFGTMSLPLVFNFSEKGDATECTMDSPSQGAKGIPTEVVLCTADSISLTCNAIGATYSARIADGAITGTFNQRGMSFPLTLTEEAPIAERRPQTPQPPYPYEVKDTSFTAPDGAILSAAITLPQMKKGEKVPAIVMVTGSGPQNRDEEMLDHKPFAVIADYLARNGVASIRYDDRGTGKSTGNYLTATTYTFKDDAKSGIEFMRTLPGIGKVGVLGHSEGGTIAFMLGAENVPDFIVSLAGMTISGKEALMMQNSRLLDKSGVSGKEKENSLALISRLFDTMADQARKGVSEPIDIDSLVASVGSVPSEVVASIKGTQKVRTPWFDTLLTIDSAESISKTKCPVLAINGDKDTQVEVKPNLDVIRNHCKSATIKEMPGLNHLLQHAKTGETAEYDQIRETISPEVLEIILQFIKNN